MAKKRKKSHVVTMREKECFKITIHIDPWKVSVGHQDHTTGSGAHNDKRTRRQRVRSAAVRSAIADSRG